MTNFKIIIRLFLSLFALGLVIGLINFFGIYGIIGLVVVSGFTLQILIYLEQRKIKI